MVQSQYRLQPLLLSFAVTLQLLAVPLAPQRQPGPAVFGRIVRLDPRFDLLVQPDAALEKVADGFQWVEGPVWDRKTGHLLFSDIPQNSVHKLAPNGESNLLLKPSGYTGRQPFLGREPGSNGLTFDRSGRLVLAEHGDRRIARLEPDGRKTTLAERYKGRRLNSPNDLVFDSNGNLYFTDPPYGLPQAFDDPQKELTFSGVYRLSAGGKLTLLTRALRSPNGVALSPDEQTLYVSNSDRSRAVWMAFELGRNGVLGKGRVLADVTEWTKHRPGAPDGMKVDRSGNLFAAGPGGFVFSPAGDLLGTVETGGPTSNCAWGRGRLGALHHRR